MRDLILILVLAAFLIFTLYRPFIGVLGWAWFSIMIPHQLTWSFAYDLPMVQYVAIATFLSFAFHFKKLQFPVEKTGVLCGLFLIWSAVTTMVSFDVSLSLDRFIFVIKVFALFFAIILAINTREKIQALVWVLAISLGYYGTWGGARSIVTGGAYRISGPPGTYIGDNNDMALAIVMVVPLLFYLFWSSWSPWLRAGIVIVSICSVLAVLTTFSRGGFVALTVMLLVFVLKSSRRRFLPIVFVCGAALAAFQFMPESWHERMGTIQTYEEDRSAQGRLEMWAFAWRVALDNPFAGGGYEVFRNPVAFAKYGPDIARRAPHSIVFQVLGEHGFFGLALYLSIWASAWLTASRVRKLTKGDNRLVWAFHLAGMTQASMAGYFAAGLFLSKAYFDMLIIVFALPILLQQVLKKKI